MSRAAVLERAESEVRPLVPPGSALKTLAQFLGLLAVIWCVLFSAYSAFPYVRSGAENIYRAKVQLLRQGLDTEVVIFGNSKVLSGFIPARFDEITGLRSYNLGLPDEQRFIPNLEQLVSRGRGPRFVLLTVTDSAPDRHATAFRFLNDDRAIADRLFPFRHFPRDLTIFMLRSGTYGGPSAFYRESQRIVERVYADRGYYFIEARTYFPENKLPGDFQMSGDRPNHMQARPVLSSADASRLRSIAERSGIQIWFVPSYYRPGEYGLAPEHNDQLAAMVASSSQFRVAGPDYWIFPREWFSDAVHLNPAGAREYTRRLADLLAPALGK